VLMVIFAVHRYGRSLGLDAILLERAARVSGNGSRPPGRWLEVIT